VELNDNYYSGQTHIWLDLIFIFFPQKKVSIHKFIIKSKNSSGEIQRVRVTLSDEESELLEQNFDRAESK
jgi:hypothetical protein